MGLSRRACGATLLEALPTVDRTTLSGLEGYRRLLAALRANGGGFDPLVTLAAQHLASFGLAGFAPLRFVLETLIGEEKLLARGEYKLCPAIDTLEDLIPVLHAQHPCSNGPSLLSGSVLAENRLRLGRLHPRLASAGLILSLPCLLPAPLASQSFLHSSLFTRFQVERVSPNFLDDIFLLNLALEAAKRVFQRFPFLKSNFGQPTSTPVSA